MATDNQLPPEILAYRKDFADKNKRFSDDVKHVAENFNELNDRKYRAVLRLHSISHEDPKKFHADVLAGVKELEHVLKLEQRYLRLISGKYAAFYQQARRIGPHSIRKGYIFDSVPGFIELNEAFFHRMNKINDQIKDLLDFIKIKNEHELIYVRGSLGNFFTKDLTANFLAYMERFSVEEVKQDEIYRLIRTVNQDNNILAQISKDLLHKWEASDNAVKVTLGIAAAGNVSWFIQGANSIPFAIGTMLVALGLVCGTKRFANSVDFKKK